MKSKGLFLRADQIDQAVRELYRKGGYTVLSQVRNGTGFERAPRTADVLAISTWPSRGLFAEGIEIKVSKSDLVKELSMPQKAHEIARYCKHWWLAVSEGLVDETVMVPPTWGVIEVNDKLKAKVTRRAEVLEAAPMDALFVCSILRNFSESYVHCSEIESRIKTAREEEQKRADTMRGYRLKELETAFQRFKAASGIDLITDRGHPVWEIGEIGKAVKLITSLRHSPIEEIQAIQATLQASLAAVEEALRAFSGKREVAA